jgi:hypothetical protein
VDFERIVFDPADHHVFAIERTASPTPEGDPTDPLLPEGQTIRRAEQRIGAWTQLVQVAVDPDRRHGSPSDRRQQRG